MDQSKPKLKLTGKNGNAFSLMAHAIRAAKGAGWTNERIDALLNEAQSGDYNHVLRTLCTHFEVS